MLKGHVSIKIVVKGCRYYISTEISNPLLNGIFVMNLIESAFDASFYSPVSVLKFASSFSIFIVGNIDGISEELLHLFQNYSRFVGAGIFEMQELLFMILS